MQELTTAQKIHQMLGIGFVDDKRAHGNKNASPTKRGTGRYAEHGEPGSRLTKQKPLRAYRALMAYFASKRVSG